MILTRSMLASHRNARLAIAALLLATALPGWRPASGQEGDRNGAADGAEPGRIAEEPPAGVQRAPVNDAARRRAYNTAIVLLGGILICGVALIAVVLLWGHRLRRIARQPLPKIAPRDELFYLKKRKDPGPASPDEAADDPGTPLDTDTRP